MKWRLFESVKSQDALKMRALTNIQTMDLAITTNCKKFHPTIRLPALNFISSLNLSTDKWNVLFAPSAPFIEKLSLAKSTSHSHSQALAETSLSFEPIGSCLPIIQIGQYSDEFFALLSSHAALENGHFDFETEITAIEPGIDAVIHHGMVDNFTTTIHAIPLDFRIDRSKFTFVTTRAEPRLLFDPPQNQRSSRTKLSPIKPVGNLPDDSSDHRRLEDILLELLQPPFHEVLSDPQLSLPQNPFHYQAEGILWLKERQNALLADEMGLGKTMQAIIAARLLYREGKINQVLIVCPKPLIANWQSELRKWWPNVLHATKVADADIKRFLRLELSNTIIKIVNYDRLNNLCEWLSEQSFSHDLIIIDEAHFIKNRSSLRSKAVKLLHAKRRWALTGTPLETRIEDLTSIFEFVKPGLTAPTEQTEIQQKKNPYFLRRKAEEVLPQLPDLIEQDIYIELSDTQRNAYDRLEREGVLTLNAEGEQITVQHVFALILNLKKVCNFDPESGDSAKLDRLSDDFQEIIENEKKALVFSQFKENPFGILEIKARLAERIRSNGDERELLEYYGGMSESLQASTFKRFNDSPKHTGLLLTYKAGGVGHTLTAANYVFLFDRWWNPAVEDQAIKRAHRLGQTEKVFVRRFICKNTIEERIANLLVERRRIFQDVIDDNRPHANMGLTQDEVFSLFRDLTARPKQNQPEPITVPKKRLSDITWQELEEIVAEFYRFEGYEADLTNPGADGGIDVIATKKSSTATEYVIIQCKHQKDKVGREVCQQLWGNMKDYVTKAVIVTTSSFSKHAIEFCYGKRIELIDRKRLVKICRDCKIADFAGE